MYLNIEDEKSKKIALNTKSINYENNINEYDAFRLLIKDVGYEIINVLCEKAAETIVEVGIVEKIENPQEIYSLITNDYKHPDFYPFLLEKAYELIHEGQKLGTRMDGKHNASSWISHCLIEGELMGEFASAIGLDPHTAMKLGFLHDIGRKKVHNFFHTVRGFEYLIEEGYINEAFCALTHSFIPIPKDGINKGNRCAIGDPAIDGFYINEKGEGVFEDGALTDDVKLFLDNYEYNSYDFILNLADLMAISEKVISPYDRVLNIYSKREPDPRNSNFFKICLINSFNRFLNILEGKNNYEPVNIIDMKSQEEIDLLLHTTSDSFMNYYLNNIKKENPIKKISLNK